MALNYGPTNSKQRDAAQHVCNCIEIIFIRDQISLRARSLFSLCLSLSLIAFILSSAFYRLLTWYQSALLFSLFLSLSIVINFDSFRLCVCVFFFCHQSRNTWLWILCILCWAISSSRHFIMIEKKNVDRFMCMKCLVFDVWCLRRVFQSVRSAQLYFHFLIWRVLLYF